MGGHTGLPAPGEEPWFTSPAPTCHRLILETPGRPLPRLVPWFHSLLGVHHVRVRGGSEGGNFSSFLRSCSSSHVSEPHYVHLAAGILRAILHSPTPAPSTCSRNPVHCASEVSHPFPTLEPFQPASVSPPSCPDSWLALPVCPSQRSLHHCARWLDILLS